MTNEERKMKNCGDKRLKKHLWHLSTPWVRVFVKTTCCKRKRFCLLANFFINNAFPFTLTNDSCHHTALSKSTGTNQNKMVGTLNKLSYILHLFYSISEVLSINNCSEFKRILHITTFFVTTFFVVVAKISFFSQKSKSKRNIFYYSALIVYIPLSLPNRLYQDFYIRWLRQCVWNLLSSSLSNS